jgi:predicted SAM-dependent methyltransferase
VGRSDDPTSDTLRRHDDLEVLAVGRVKSLVRSRVGSGPVPLRLVQDARMEAHLALVRMRSRLSRGPSLPNHGVKLHYGCGSRALPGWLNIDGWPSPAVDLVADLRRPLPLPASSCSFIFSEHVFEHIDRPFRLAVLREFRRVLEPEGVLRLVVPDLALFVDAYERADLEWFNAVLDLELTTPSDLAVGMNSVFVDHFHRFIDDHASLTALLHQAGFDTVERSTFDGSTSEELRVDTGLPSRTLCSLYVEARGRGRG